MYALMVCSVHMHDLLDGTRWYSYWSVPVWDVPVADSVVLGWDSIDSVVFVLSGTRWYWYWNVPVVDSMVFVGLD